MGNVFGMIESRDERINDIRELLSERKGESCIDETSEEIEMIESKDERINDIRELPSEREDKSCIDETSEEIGMIESKDERINDIRELPSEREGKSCIDETSEEKHYSSSHKILLVGEGDFSFSLCLAKAFGSATNMFATSLDSQVYLFKNYKKALSNISELQTRGCRVMHCINARNMAQHDELCYRKFDRIIFNFPHAKFIAGDSRANQLRRHQKLVRSFFENARRMLELDGEIHVTHKSNGFYLEWNLKELASQSGLMLIEEVDFKLEDYPGYSNKYGFDNFKTDLSFNYRSSKTYKFGHDFVAMLSLILKSFPVCMDS